MGSHDGTMDARPVSFYLNRLKNILDQILREHSRPHESEGVYATNMSLLLEEVARDLKTQ